MSEQAIVAPGAQNAATTAINSSGGLSQARTLLAQQRASGTKALTGDGKSASPQTETKTADTRNSEAARILGQASAEARQARQAEVARQAQEAEAKAKAEAETAQQAANNPHGTDGLETEQPGEGTDAQAEGQEQSEDFDQAILDLGEGVSMTRAEVKQHLLRQSDYTQKTQRLQSERQAFETDRSERLDVLDSLYRHLQAQAGQPKSMRQWLAEDPVDGMMRFAEQQERLEQLATAQRVRTQEQAHHVSKLRDSTLKALSDKHGDKAQGYFDDAITYLHGQMGGSKEALVATVLHPVAIDLLHKAKQWDALQASQKDVKRVVAGKPLVVKPGAKFSQQAGAQSKFQNAVAALKASGNKADAVAVLQARRAAQGR